jgi:hypothetical protein
VTEPGDDWVRGQLERLPAVDVDEVAARRLRQRVLGTLGSRQEPPSRRADPRRPARWLAGLATPILLVALVFAASRVWPARRPVDPRPPFAAAVFAAGATARWSQQLGGDTELVTLSDGLFRVDIQHAQPHVVVVSVPDGRIDDLGTVFQVLVSGGRTTWVRVEEGRVTLRLRDADAVTLVSGQAWSRPAQAAALATPPVNEVRVTAPPDVNRKRRLARGQSNATSDGAEDAAYLEVIRLVRESRSNEARLAARAYLRRFPNGFRREELGIIAK